MELTQSKYILPRSPCEKKIPIKFSTENTNILNGVAKWSCLDTSLGLKKKKKKKKKKNIVVLPS